MTNAKTEKFRRIRGAILKLLAHEHPGSIDSKVLQFLLDDIGYPMTEEELSSHLAYLSDGDKKCVRVDVRKSTGIEIKLVTITPKGLDVLDGFSDDCGVDTRF